MELLKLKITEATGGIWWDNFTWVECPDVTECRQTYNAGATIEIYAPNSDPQTDDEIEFYSI